MEHSMFKNGIRYEVDEVHDGLLNRRFSVARSGHTKVQLGNDVYTPAECEYEFKKLVKADKEIVLWWENQPEGTKLTHLKTGNEYLLLGPIKTKVDGHWRTFIEYEREGERYARCPLDMEESFKLQE